MISHIYNIIIDRSVGSPVHDREVFDADKAFLSMLIPMLQLPGATGYATHMEMHTFTINK